MDLSDLHAIKPERVTDTIYDLLRENIIAQRLPAGHKINLDELAQRFGVSRTPVHEALMLLDSDGLVEVVPRKGTFVTRITSRDIAETLDVRRALELLACETVVVNAGDGDFRLFRRLIEEMESSTSQAATAPEAARIHDAKNLEFHQRLVHLSRNQRLIATYEGLRAHLRIARAHVNASAWSERLPEERAEHDAIVQALAARDLGALRAALDRHLRRSKASLLTDLGDDEGRDQATDDLHAT